MPGQSTFSRIVMTGNLNLSGGPPPVLFLDPNGADRTVILPPLGAVEIKHIGGANTLTLQTPDLEDFRVLSAGDAERFIFDGQDWQFIFGQGAVPVWTPTKLYPTIWLHHDTGLFTSNTKSASSSNGDPVGAWADNSGNGNDYLQSSSGDRPSFTASGLDGHGVVTFAGDWLKLASCTFSNARSVILVAKCTSGTGYAFCMGGNNGDGSVHRQIFNNGADKFLFDADNVGVDPVNAYTDDTWQASCIIQDGPNSRIRTAINGDSLTNHTSIVTASFSAQPSCLGHIEIEAFVSPLTGAVAELIVVDRAITDEEWALLQTYLTGEFPSVFGA